MSIKHFFKRLVTGDAPTGTVKKLSRQQIPDHVLLVVEKLSRAGYQAYLVGGCVRDLLTGSHPKDFDVTTDATPQEVRRLFRNSRLIGRRFLLVHVFFKDDLMVEVATFRGNPTDHSHQRSLSQEGRILQDNVFGSIEEDAMRRDFTINALFYNPLRDQIMDYTVGLADIEHRLIRLIGDPETRYREDPVRMLRALRFAAKLNFKIESKTEAPLYHMGKLLLSVPPARLFEETLKLFTHGYALSVLALLRQYGFDNILFPSMAGYTDKDWTLITGGLKATDERYHAHKTCSSSFLIALFLYPAYRERVLSLSAGKRVGYLLKEEAIAQVLRTACAVLCIPKRITYTVRSIWHLQYALITVKPNQVERLVAHPEFRPAFDLLWLRANTNEPELMEWATWWKKHYGDSVPGAT